MTRLGASRMSSVFGLKVTPEHGDGFVADAAGGSFDARGHGDLALAIDLLDLLR